MRSPKKMYFKCYQEKVYWVNGE